MTSTQFNYLLQLENLIQLMGKEDETFQELVNDADLFGGKLDDIENDISHRIEIFNMIKQYNNGESKDCASITISNTMGVIIIEAESDYVFGYSASDDVKHFFLSEVEYKLEDEEDTNDEDSEFSPFFTIGEDGMELNLNHAMRF